MIAVDTSTLAAYLAGEPGGDVEALDLALSHNQAQLPPVVVAELLSAPRATEQLARLLRDLPMLSIADGYWQRAGELRRAVRQRGHKAALADTLICQSCLDHDMALLTRDSDFRAFARFGGLKLA